MLVNAIGPGYTPDGAVFAVSMTALLFVGGATFVENLVLFLG